MTIDLATELARNALFSGMDQRAVAELSESASWLHLRSGDVLIQEGGPSDALYLLVTGRLRVDLGAGRTADVGVGDSIGELGVLAGQPRSSTVNAVRDSRVIRLDRDALLAALFRYPQALLALGQVVIERLQHNASSERPPRSNISAVTVLETHDGVGREEFLRRMIEALQRFGTVKLIDEDCVDAALGEAMAATPFADDQANFALMQWLNQQEFEVDFLVYTASGAQAAWLRRCLRQCDRVLLLAEDSSLGSDTNLLKELSSHRLDVPLEMVLKRSAWPLPLENFRAHYRCDDHYYWQSGQSKEIDSLVRQLSGHANGLVLGGGGARGFAHIGLIRALDELGIEIDLAGGSSMGALIAALRANGLSAAQISQEMRATFIDRNFLNDYMIPRVALIRGRRFLKRLRALFGDLHIEHMPMPYFCVSTNLSLGRVEVHRDGELATWIATSMAVPGVAPPVAWNGHLLSDGSVINALPVDVMAALGRGPIIASNVSTDGVIAAPGIKGPEPEALLNWSGKTDRPGLVDILFRTATLTSESGNLKRADQADLCLQMPVQHIGMFQWDALDELARAGYEHAMAELVPVLEQFTL